MSKYSLLGVCQPQRGGLSYFCGLSLPPALQRATDSDRDCRSGDGLSLLIDYLYEQIVGIPSPLSVPLLFLHFPSLQTDICLMIFSLSRDLSRVVTLSGSALPDRLCQCRASTDYVIQEGNRRNQMRKAERMEEGELPILAS